MIGKSAVGAILTGMGKDGAKGLECVKPAQPRSGAAKSALIYGMPRVAFERGAVMHQHSLSHMADAILDACEVETSHGGARPDHGADAA